MKRRYTIWTAVVIAFALLAAACGGSSESTDTTVPSEPTETTVAPETTTTTIAATTTAAGEPIDLEIWADEKPAPILETLSTKDL